jgi:hypothetical protein
MEEMLPLMPPDMPRQVLDFGLHVNPASLKAALQAAIDASTTEADEIVLGYGFCSMAVVGLQARNCTLVVPDVDDCISIFLGSRDEYQRQTRAEPGTYYLTKGWIEVGDTPFSEYERLAERYGPTRAERLVRLSIKHYTRLALIDTGSGDMTSYREYTQALAQRWDLRFEEIQGSTELVRKMLFGPWTGGSAGEDFVVVPPGETIRLDHFLKPRLQAPGNAAVQPQLI